MRKANVSRRDALKGVAALAAGATLVPGLAFADEAASASCDPSLTPQDAGKPTFGKDEPMPDGYVEELRDPNDTVSITSPSGMTGSNWMSYLSDDAIISDVNIPGTHDSGMYSLLLHIPDNVAQTQSIRIPEQLALGVRLLDIRVGRPCTPGGREDGQLFVYHGKEMCPAYYDLGTHHVDTDRHLTLNDVFEEVYEFLAQNPNEFVLIAPKEEIGENEYYDEHMLSFIKSKLAGDPSKNRKPLWIDHRLPTVGEARGRIVLLNRNALWYKMDKPDWGIRVEMDAMEQDGFHSYPKSDHDDAGCEAHKYVAYLTQLHNEYEWKHSHDDKRRSVEQTLVNCTERLPLKGEQYPKKWADVVFNYTSGYVKVGDVPWIGPTWGNVNRFINGYEFQKGFRYGWTLSDFVGGGDTHFNPSKLYLSNYFKDEARRTDRYVSELHAGHGGNASEAKKYLLDNGYKLLGTCTDCNTAAKGEFIYLGYKTTDNPSDAITDIIVTHDRSTPSTFQGRSFEWVHGNGGGLVDFNAGAGGDFLYMGYTKSTQGGHLPISDVAHHINWWGAPQLEDVENNGWTVVRFAEGDKKGGMAELTRGTGGRAYVYLRYKTYVPQGGNPSGDDPQDDPVDPSPTPTDPAAPDGDPVATAKTADRLGYAPATLAGTAALAAVAGGVAWYERRRYENEHAGNKD